MNSTVKYILYFILGFLAIVFIQSLLPKPINWQRSFKTNDKIPFGLYILNKELPTLLSPIAVEKYTKTPYEYFLEEFDTINPKKETWFFVLDQEQIDKASIEKLLKAAAMGNDIFISSMSPPYLLLDSIGLGSKYMYGNTNKDTKFQLLNPYLKKASCSINVPSLEVFTVQDSTGLTILGNSGDEPGFIRKKVGKGAFYLHNSPDVFVNYHLLESNNHLYAEGVLSYINSDKLVWFDPQRNYNEQIDNFPLRFIFKHPSLRWAWYFTIAGFFIFILFNIKRRQRIVPVIPPVQNTSVEFVRTIANLYYQENNHEDLIQKMIVYFLEHTRIRLRIDTSKLDEKFIENYHKKTGKDKQDIKEAVDLIIEYRKTNQPRSEKELNKLYQSIQKISI